MNSIDKIRKNIRNDDKLFTKTPEKYDVSFKVIQEILIMDKIPNNNTSTNASDNNKSTL